VIAERGADAGSVGRDEDFAAIQYDSSPRRTLLWLAAARRVSGGIAAVEPLRLDGLRQVAHHGEQAVPDRALSQIIDDCIGRVQVLGRRGDFHRVRNVLGAKGAFHRNCLCFGQTCARCASASALVAGTTGC